METIGSGQELKKVLFVSQDPGETNALIPIIREMGASCSIDVIAKDIAVHIYKDRGIPYNDIRELVDDVNEDGLEKLLKIYCPDILVTGTSSADFFERKMWDAARRLGIKSVAILDSWCYYGLRFSKFTFSELGRYECDQEIVYWPDVLLTMDSFSKNMLIKHGLQKENIRIVGQPFLEVLRNKYFAVDENVICDYKVQLMGNCDKKLIVFGSDNLSDSFLPSSIDYWGYDEKTIFECVFDSVSRTCNNPEEFAILIRPHPKEREGNWSEVLNRITGGSIDVFIDGSTREETVICSSDIVVGMWSMLLVEACLADKKVISVQIGAKRNAEFVLTDSQAIIPVIDQETLDKQFESYFAGDDSVGKVDWSISSNSINNTIKCIFELL